MDLVWVDFGQDVPTGYGGSYKHLATLCIRCSDPGADFMRDDARFPPGPVADYLVEVDKFTGQHVVVFCKPPYVPPKYPSNVAWPEAWPTWYLVNNERCQNAVHRQAATRIQRGWRVWFARKKRIQREAQALLTCMKRLPELALPPDLVRAVMRHSGTVRGPL